MIFVSYNEYIKPLFIKLLKKKKNFNRYTTFLIMYWKKIEYDLDVAHSKSCKIEISKHSLNKYINKSTTPNKEFNPGRSSFNNCARDIAIIYTPYYKPVASL